MHHALDILREVQGPVDIKLEMLKQKGHYNSMGRTQGKGRENPEGKEEIGWMEEKRESFSSAA